MTPPIHITVLAFVGCQYRFASFDGHHWRDSGWRKIESEGWLDESGRHFYGELFT